MKIHGIRVFFILAAFIIIIAVFVVRLMSFQLVNGDTYRAQANKTIKSAEAITAPRGEILDRYGRRLATNRVGYTVDFSRSYLPVKQENAVILKLTKILSQDGEQWNDSLPITTTRPYKYTAATTAELSTFYKTTDIASGTSADSAMATLMDSKHYNVDQSLSQDDKRTIVGVRYEMQARSFSINNPLFECATDVSMSSVTKIEERSLELPGVEINEDPIRVYPEGTLAPHVIGTIGPIFAEEYPKLKEQNYAMNDLIGRGGIEQAMETYLRGTDGIRSIEQNKNGDVTNEQVTTPATPGDTVVLTIDSRIQKAMQAALPVTIQQIVRDSYGSPELGANAISGAAVALDVKTGEVLGMATYPSYDLNTYKKEYGTLLKQAGNPLLNRCITGAYRPGSTFKPVSATAGLLYGAITPTMEFYCPGRLNYKGHTFNCDGYHGSNNVEDGLKKSCNVFFYNVGIRLGIDKLDKVGAMLGLGQKTGIEISGESSGVLSGPKEKQANGGGAWNPGDTLQSAIGQFDNQFTLLQLANYVSTIVNGGTRHQVHIVKKVVSYDGTKTVLDNSTPKVVEKTNIPQSVLSVVMDGMQKVVEEGTAVAPFRGYNISVGGKTGTAQVPGGYNGLFVGYAPADNPQIAVAVVVEHGHNGYQTAPVAKAAFSTYFLSRNNVSGPVKDDALLP